MSTHRTSHPSPARALLGALLAGAAVAAAGCSSTGGGAPEAPGFTAGPPGERLGERPGEGDGRLPESGVAPDTDTPAVTNLRPELRRAVERAAQALAGGAAGRPMELRITSGWRTPGYQRALFDDAVRTHGSARQARQYVASPTESEHTRGEAVDLGPMDAADWLTRNGSEFGLCQVYANEMWHFEPAPSGSCPDLVADATARTR